MSTTVGDGDAPGTGITISDGPRQVTYEPQQVYFAFADGRLSYDCVACGAACCRGHGYLLGGADELRAQVHGRRALPVFIEARREAGRMLLGVVNTAPQCFHLTSDGACGVHTAGGLGAKPETCRLFQFNWLRRVGPYLVVGPHQDLCPLTIADVGDRAEVSRHDQLRRGMAMRPLVTSVPSCATVVDPSAAIALERRVVELSEECLDAADYFEFCVRQLMMAGWADADARTSLAAHASTWNALVGTPARTELGRHPALTRTVIAATPMMRARLLFRADGPPVLLPSRAPHAMFGAYLLAEAAIAAGASIVTIQTLSKLLPAFQSLIALLSLCDQRVRWVSDADIDLPTFADLSHRPRFLKLVRALLLSRSNGASVLSDLLQDVAPPDPIERVLFLKDVSRGLLGRVQSVDQAEASPKPTRSLSRLRVAARHWAFTHVPEDAVQTLVN